MQRIEPKDYKKIRPLVDELAGVHLSLIALLEGLAPGQVYADDAANPRSAYLNAGGAPYLVGDPDNPAFHTAVNAALPRDTCFVLFCDPGRWSGALDEVLKDTYAVRAARCYHTLRQLKIVDWQARLPAGFTMRPVNADLLAEELENRDDVVEGILDEWASLEAFLAHGFGSCLVHDTTIVSWSLIDCVHGDRCEMGINTDGDYRRQGLGTLAAAANAASALARGFTTVGWHRWANNAGSLGVAENVGFEKAADYDVFVNHWAAENVSDMSQAEFRAFAEAYEREFEAHPPAASGYPHLVAATAWALARDRASCFRHLHKAVDMGWLRGVEHLREVWPEFFWNPNLDQMEEWHELVKRFEKR